MKAIISRVKGLKGEIYPSPSKSYSHRAFFLSMLRTEPTILFNPLTKGDVAKTIDICQAFGSIVENKNDYEWLITPPEDLIAPSRIIDCGNSGTSVRILSALSLVITGSVELTGIFFERERPIDDLMESIATLGVKFKHIYDKNQSRIGIQFSNKCITSNNIKIRGDISSQFITGLIIAAATLKLRPDIAQKKQFFHETFVIETTTQVKSYPYLQITKRICENFGVKMDFNKNDQGKLKITIFIREKSEPQNNMKNQDNFRYEIPGDFSSAAFMIAAGSLYGINEGVRIKNIGFDEFQGDSAIISLLKKMGASLFLEHNDIVIEGRKSIFDNNTDKYIQYLKNIDIDCSDIPDLLPILTVIGGMSQGTMTLNNVEHVRLKETDRVSVMARELNKLSIETKEERNRLKIISNKTIEISDEIEFDPEEDHRIVMALTIMVSGLGEKNSKWAIPNAEYSNDSYPDFYEHLKQLGVKIRFE